MLFACVHAFSKMDPVAAGSGVALPISKLCEMNLPNERAEAFRHLAEDRDKSNTVAQRLVGGL